MKRSTKYKAHRHLVIARLKVGVGPHNTVLTQQTTPTLHSLDHSQVRVGAGVEVTMKVMGMPQATVFFGCILLPGL